MSNPANSIESYVNFGVKEISTVIPHRFFSLFFSRNTDQTGVTGGKSHACGWMRFPASSNGAIQRRFFLYVLNDRSFHPHTDFESIDPIFVIFEGIARYFLRILSLFRLPSTMRQLKE